MTEDSRAKDALRMQAVDCLRGQNEILLRVIREIPDRLLVDIASEVLIRNREIIESHLAKHLQYSDPL